MIFKIIGFCFVVLTLVGCNNAKPSKPTHKHYTKHKLFQSVDENKAIILQSGKNKNYCSRCGMKLAKYYKTNHVATYKGKVYQYCSLHCLEDHLEDGVVLKNPKVVDTASLKFISIANAVYVVGSNRDATMSRVSKYAFSSLADAKKFQSKYGGEIMDFNSARQKAQQDFKYKRKY